MNMNEMSISPPRPNVREAGAGAGVVCLHCNGSSAAQWGGLMVLLAPRFRVLAPDLYGAGLSPCWPQARSRHLDDEVDLIAPVLEQAGAGTVLVGHSYGAAVALVAALRRPSLVRALVVYEPTLFSLVEQERAAPNEADGIRLVCRVAGAALRRGDADEAARHFIDFWGGAGSWERTPTQRRPAIAHAMRDIGHWEHALFQDPRRAQDFASLDVPVLYLNGSETTAPARAVARLLTRVLPDVRHQVLPGLGHMGPLTDPGVINNLIARFLTALDAPMNFTLKEPAS